MEQVSRIALAILARGIETVNAPVRDDLRGRNDVARCERRPKLVNNLGVGRDRCRVRPPSKCDSVGSHACASLRQRPAAVPGDPYPLSDPPAHLRLEPPDRAWTERHGLRKDAILDVLIDRAARKSRACFDLLVSKKCRRPLDSLGHVRHFAAGNGGWQDLFMPCGRCRPESEPR